MTFTSRAWAQLSAEELIAFRKNSWLADCPRMVLKSQANQNPTTLYGSGFISQSSDGRLQFKIYVTRERAASNSDFLDSITAGEVIPEQCFYAFRATDSTARVWHAERLLPNFSRVATGKVIVQGTLRELVCQSRAPTSVTLKGSSLTFWVLDDSKIPTNATTIRRQSIARVRHKSRGFVRNVWTFRCCGTTFLLTKDGEDLLTVRASISEGRFPLFMEDRLVETLQFVLGRPIPWAIMRKQVGQKMTIVLTSRRTVNGNARFLPPLPEVFVDPRSGKLSTRHHRRLFECYLKHTLSFKRKRHPIWGQINAVYEASLTSFVDALALTLTVAIESLLGSEFVDIGKPTKADNQAIKDIIRHFDGWSGKEDIKARVRGSLSQLSQPRALDRLRELVKQGAITDDQLKAWKELRNPSAHGQVSSLSSEKLIRLTQKVEVLFYHLIFCAIGYRGLYLDFSEPDWPLREYPPGGKRLRSRRTDSR